MGTVRSDQHWPSSDRPWPGRLGVGVCVQDEKLREKTLEAASFQAQLAAAQQQLKNGAQELLAQQAQHEEQKQRNAELLAQLAVLSGKRPPPQE